MCVRHVSFFHFFRFSFGISPDLHYLCRHNTKKDEKTTAADGITNRYEPGDGNSSERPQGVLSDD